MLLSIIIRSFNEERHIGRLLNGIELQELPSGWACEVIVVDSGSTDSTVSIAQHMGAKVIRLNKDQFSFGRALNIGCEAASGDILLFASAHVYPIYKDWVEKMIYPFNDAKIALVYGRQTGNNLTHFSEHQVFVKWFPLKSNFNQSTPFCNNANCAIRKYLWLQQNYDETLTGLEDLDWAQKILIKGYKIAYESGAVIVHVHEETPAKIKNRYQREAIAMKQIFPNVHFSLFDFMRLFITNILFDISQAFRVKVFLKEWKNIILFRYMQFYGTYLGHNQKGAVTKELKNRFYYPNGLYRSLNNGFENTEKENKRIEYS
jgi:glycosyltransferase involved in cell wall biosynthesis